MHHTENTLEYDSLQRMCLSEVLSASFFFYEFSKCSCITADAHYKMLYLQVKQNFFDKSTLPVMPI
jgi:hypothetical protein